MSLVTLIRNARHWKTGDPIDLAFERGTILDEVPATADVVVDARGATLSPGLVDLHVHLREPGQSSRETIETGTRAAAAGGFTAVACMPNTDPVVDNIAWVEWVRARARAVGRCRVHPIAAVTLGQTGERLTEFMALRNAGAVALSDDGHPIRSAAVMRRALEYARHAALPIVCHEEDPELSAGGHMNEGAVATRLGIQGIPPAAESVMVRRDVELAELTGGRVHLAHLSCTASFEGLREAKRRGLGVTGETCPHYWMLTEDTVSEWGTAAKMNPPLRTERDRVAAIAAIADGTIDCLTTDHAPHHEDDKRQPFEMAPFGIVGLETALALTITGLVRPGHISLPWALQLWTEGPRRVFRLPEVRLSGGFPADLTLIDPDAEWTVDPATFHSKSRSTPFAGMTVTGRVLATWCEGELTHAADDLSLTGQRPKPDSLSSPVTGER
jgi:dihydroorotase